MSTPTRRFHVPSALRPSTLRIESDEARALVAQGAVLIDVRREDDPSAVLPGSQRVPPDEIPGALTDLGEGVTIVLACT